MQLKEIIHYLESLAPASLQENYDNSGLIVGSPEKEITGALVCLDSLEAVIDEAINLGINLVIAHHPIVFSGLKKITGKTYIERVVIKAIRHEIAIYAIHTNLDHVQHGVNGKIAERLGLTDTYVLEPKPSLLLKLVVFVPHQNAEDLRNALFREGAGHISEYDECSYNLKGEGTFRPSSKANPTIGEAGIRHIEAETRIEVILPRWARSSVLKAMVETHPYEEVAYDLYALENSMGQIGSGLVGNLAEPMDVNLFLQLVKKQMKTSLIRHTALIQPKVSTIAVCGGSGSFLLSSAIASGADVLVTSDFKYHQFFDADGRIVIADIGHYESEQFTIDLLIGWLSEKFPTFATHKTGVVTNPINYL